MTKPCKYHCLLVVEKVLALRSSYFILVVIKYEILKTQLKHLQELEISQNLNIL